MLLAAGKLWEEVIKEARHGRIISKLVLFVHDAIPEMCQSPFLSLDSDFSRSI